MIDLLVSLGDKEKQAIVQLCCVVEAQSRGGSFSVRDTQIHQTLTAIFPHDWEGFSNIEYRNDYILSCIQLDANESINLICNCAREVKFEFHLHIVSYVNNSGKASLACINILQQIGYEELIKEQARKEREEREVNEDDGTYIVENPLFVRIINIDAVRGENNTSFNVSEEDEDETHLVYANYEEWLNNGICPTAGTVGIVEKKAETAEGTLCYVLCEQNLIVPVLEFGLEEINQHDYIEKRGNNKILIYDKTHKRCLDLRNKPKVTIKEGIKPKQKNSNIVRHFYATIQSRFEVGKSFPPNNIVRHVELIYSPNGREVTITVKGIIQPRHAVIESDNGTILRYRDTTRDDIYYEVETSKSDGSIVRVSLFQPDFNNNYIEYRYTK